MDRKIKKHIRICSIILVCIVISIICYIGIFYIQTLNVIDKYLDLRFNYSFNNDLYEQFNERYSLFTDEYLSNHEKYDIIDTIYNNQLNGKLKQYKIVAVDHSHGKVFYKVTTDFITIDAKNNTIENTYNLAFEFSPFSIINVKLHSVEPINDNTHTHNDEHVH